ncbi:hypothetical protein EBZ80_18465 [bacterium]|nr:hypothetical protein [bacterium]
MSETKEERLNVSRLQTFLTRHVRPLLSHDLDLELALRHDKHDKELTVSLRREEGSDVREVARIKMSYFRSQGKHLDVLLESHTDLRERRKGYNTILRLVALLVSLHICYRKKYPVAAVTSYAINWISVWSLLKLGFDMQVILDREGKPVAPTQCVLTAAYLRQHMPMQQDAPPVARSKPWHMVKMQWLVPTAKPARKAVRDALLNKLAEEVQRVRVRSEK